MPRLPPFFALRALEAAARHKSYSRAADELSVTHGAVSQQIRKLEDELGATLFARQGNSMIPTADAARLAAEVGRATDILQAAVASFSMAAERGPLVLSLDRQFANRWMAPRLSRFLADAPGGPVEIRVEERLADFVSDGVDLGVRYGVGDYPGVESTLLIAETLFPVCSPAFLAAHPISEPADLLNVPLLRGFRPWSLWFEQLGLEAPPPEGVFLDDTLMLLDAAAQGLGVALARSGMAEPDLNAGRLVRPLPGSVDSALGFYLAWRADSRKLARILAVRDWIRAEAAAGSNFAPHEESTA